MTEETGGPSKPNSGRVDASRAATARKINRLPPGEHLVELRAKAVPDHMVLRIVAYNAELQAGMVLVLDRIFGPKPSASDEKGTRSYASQGRSWFSLCIGCNLQDADLQDITLAELAEKINGKHVIAVINDSGFLSRVQPI